MCHYDSRCKTRVHRPETVCPYAKRNSRSASSIWTPGYGAAVKRQIAGPHAARIPESSGVGRRVDRAPQLYGGGSVLDLLLWQVLLSLWDGTYSPVGVVLGALLIALPFFVGLDLLSKCRAWLTDGTRRCEQPRKGFLHRCSDHQSQPLTIYDIAGALSILIGSVNILAWIVAALP